MIYGGNQIYRRMCRFFSGFVHKHPLLKDYDYYWRLECVDVSSWSTTKR